MFPYKFIGEIYYYEITLSEAINDETELKVLINKLDNYSPLKIKKKKEENTRVLESARKLFDVRDFLALLFWPNNYMRQKIKRKTMT